MRILEGKEIDDVIVDLLHERAHIIYARDDENGFVYCTVKYPMIVMTAKDPMNEIDQEKDKDQID